MDPIDVHTTAARLPTVVGSEDITPLRLVDVIAVAAGGVLGTLARFAVIQGVDADHMDGLLATFFVNGTGAFMLGLASGWLVDTFARCRWLRPFLCVGIIGSFTTFSTLMAELHTLNRTIGAASAALWIMVSVSTGLAAAWLGLVLASRLPRPAGAA